MTTPTPDPDEVAREIARDHMPTKLPGYESRVGLLAEEIATALRARDEAHRAERERAYREGAEAMREACAVECESLASMLDHPSVYMGGPSLNAKWKARNIADAIRALPLPPEGADPDWGWWAGREESLFDVGPLPTKEDAIAEALEQGVFEEVQTKDGWRRLVHYAECRGLHYDCDECGTVPEACQECKDYLYPDEVAGTFSGSRNYGCVMVNYDD